MVERKKHLFKSASHSFFLTAKALEQLKFCEHYSLKKKTKKEIKNKIKNNPKLKKPNESLS